MSSLLGWSPLRKRVAASVCSFQQSSAACFLWAGENDHSVLIDDIHLTEATTPVRHLFGILNMSAPITNYSYIY
jgi:hypothetical protein